MNESKLTATALEHGVDLGLLRELYNWHVACTRNDPQFSRMADDPRSQQIDLDSAVMIAVARENGLLGYEYARAFLNDDPREIAAIMETINAKPPSRWPDIHRNTQISIHTMSLQTHIPELIVSFADDNSVEHPTLSPEDKSLLHRLFRERIQIVDHVIRENQSKDIPDSAENIQRFNDTHARIWDTQNKGHEFPSLTEGPHAQRDSYDAGRSKAWYQRQPSPAAPSAP